MTRKESRALGLHEALQTLPCWVQSQAPSAARGSEPEGSEAWARPRGSDRCALGETTRSRACKVGLGTRPALLSISCPQGSETRVCRKSGSPGGVPTDPLPHSACGTGPSAGNQSSLGSPRLGDVTSPPQDFRTLGPHSQEKPLEDSASFGNRA